MSLYLDTSILVAALTVETATARVHQWLDDQTGAEFHMSDWTATEVSSALALKHRTGHLTAPERARALTLFHRLQGESLITLTVLPSHFQTAARFLDASPHGLRAGDALHLALAGDRGLRLITLDRRMVEAGLALGIDAQLL